MNKLIASGELKLDHLKEDLSLGCAIQLHNPDSSVLAG
jgi:hypothetical protein